MKSKRKSAKQRSLSSHQKITNDYRDAIIRDGLRVVAEARKLLDSTENCLEKSRMFPCYLSDLTELIDGLITLNGAHNAVSNVYFSADRPWKTI